MANEETDVVHCGVCGAEIPPARLKAMPDTLVCVRCSEEMGGEFELEVSITSTGKAGSLKKTGESVEVKRKRKTFR
jgi:hypothetical protein